MFSFYITSEGFERIGGASMKGGHYIGHVDDIQHGSIFGDPDPIKTSSPDLLLFEDVKKNESDLFRKISAGIYSFKRQREVHVIYQNDRGAKIHIRLGMPAPLSFDHSYF